MKLIAISLLFTLSAFAQQPVAPGVPDNKPPVALSAQEKAQIDLAAQDIATTQTKIRDLTKQFNDVRQQYDRQLADAISNRNTAIAQAHKAHNLPKEYVYDGQQFVVPKPPVTPRAPVR